jgi:alpha/beta hydrolase fold
MNRYTQTSLPVVLILFVASACGGSPASVVPTTTTAPAGTVAQNATTAPTAGATTGGNVIATTPTATEFETPASSAFSMPVGEWRGRIDVGGRSLFMECSSGTGRTVILDADMNGDMSEFGLVIPRLPDTIRACAYNRIGETGSDAPPAGISRTTADMVSDLHALLSIAGLPSPVILVGNHFGGLVALRYAARYPAEVGGLVLLDPPLPAVFLRFYPNCRAQGFSVPNVEGVEFCGLMQEAASASLKPPNVPVSVMTRSDPQGFTASEYSAWTKSHTELAKSVPNGRHLIVTSANVVPQDAPDDVVREIEWVVEASGR